VFLGDIKIYMNNNRSNLNVTLIFVSLNSCKDFFYLEIRFIVIN
jgi:hypothetical protein